MEPRTALAAAIISGLAAVGLVAADVVWSLEARLDAETEDGWRTVAAQPTRDRLHEGFPRGPDCAGPTMRLVVTNDKPFSDTVDLYITYHNTTAQRTETLYQDTWRLESFDERSHTFTIPDAAFAPINRTDDREAPFEFVHVEARVGDQLWLTTCVEKEARS